MRAHSRTYLRTRRPNCSASLTESILAIRNVGVQVKTTYLSGRSVSHFIERSRICDIIIHEAITMWQVKFYMAIIVARQDRMIVVFEVCTVLLFKRQWLHRFTF